MRYAPLLIAAGWMLGCPTTHVNPVDGGRMPPWPNEAGVDVPDIDVPDIDVPDIDVPDVGEPGDAGTSEPDGPMGTCVLFCEGSIYEAIPTTEVNCQGSAFETRPRCLYDLQWLPGGGIPGGDLLDDGAGVYQPCEDKACGQGCRVCGPHEADCFEAAVLKACNSRGECVPDTGDLCEP